MTNGESARPGGIPAPELARLARAVRVLAIWRVASGGAALLAYAAAAVLIFKGQPWAAAVVATDGFAAFRLWPRMGAVLGRLWQTLPRVSPALFLLWALGGRALRLGPGAIAAELQRRGLAIGK